MSQRIIVILAIILSIADACVPNNKNDHSTIFQNSTFSNKEEVDEFYQKVFTSGLSSLEEGRLNTGQETEFRLVVFPSNSNKFVIRIKVNPKDSSIQLVYKRLAFNGSPVKGVDINLFKNIDRFENPTAYIELAVLLEQVQFWNLNNNCECDGADGDLYLLEGQEKGRYHAAFRWSPEACECNGSKEFMDLVNHIIALKSIH